VLAGSSFELLVIGCYPDGSTNFVLGAGRQRRCELLPQPLGMACERELGL
jgi:hypothetical protein